MTNKNEDDIRKTIKYKNNLIEFVRDNRVLFNTQNQYRCELLPLLDFEIKILEFFDENKFSILKKSRQMHLTTLSAAYCAWCLLFKEDYSIGIISNKKNSSDNLIEKVRIILQNYSNSIFHWEDDFIKNNKGEIRLSNGSSIKSFTPKNAGIGCSIDMFIMDEAAFFDLETALKNVFIRIMALQGSKIIIYSTPNGNNYFKELWDKSIVGDNNFKNIEFKWDDNPYYTKDWFDKKCICLGNDENTIRQELMGEFSNKKIPPSIRVNFRLDTEIYEKMFNKLEGKNVSDYLRDLIKKDLD